MEDSGRLMGRLGKVQAAGGGGVLLLLLEEEEEEEEERLRRSGEEARKRCAERPLCRWSRRPVAVKAPSILVPALATRRGGRVAL